MYFIMFVVVVENDKLISNLMKIVLFDFRQKINELNGLTCTRIHSTNRCIRMDLGK